MVRNELRQCLADKVLEGDFSAARIGPGDGHQRSLAQIVDVAVEALDRCFLPLVVAKEMEAFGQEQVNRDGFGHWDGLHWNGKIDVATEGEGRESGATIATN